MYPETKEGLVLCPSCKSANPDDNRFCGKCGAPLPRPVEPQHASGDLPKELIEFDRKIPLIAQPGSDRRKDVPEKIREQAREVIERDRLREAEKQNFSFVGPDEPRTVQMPANFLGLDTTKDAPVREVPKVEKPAESRAEQRPISFLGLDVSEPVVDRPVVESKAEPVTESRRKEVTRSSGGTFLHLDEEPRPVSRGTLSGPSFLGLGADDEVIDDEVEESHTRRNLALLILLVLIGLGATQWRAIRDNALPFVKNGTEDVKLKVKGQKPEAPAPSTAAPTDQANNANGSSGPNIEVGPMNQNIEAQKAATNPPAAPPANGATEQPPNTAATSNAGTTPPASDTNAAPTTSSTAAADSTPAADNASKATANTPAAKDDAKSAEAKTPADEPAPAKPAKNAAAKKPAKPSAQGRPQVTDEPTQAGAAELASANAASDPTLQNALLWKAVKAGNPEASVRLAENYMYGKGVAKNCDQAIVLLRSASAHSYARARGKLGAMYATGECVQQDRVQAYQWLSSALEANPSSQWTSQYRDTLWNQMTAAERSRVHR